MTWTKMDLLKSVISSFPFPESVISITPSLSVHVKTAVAGFFSSRDICMVFKSRTRTVGSFGESARIWCIIIVVPNKTSIARPSATKGSSFVLLFPNIHFLSRTFNLVLPHWEKVIYSWFRYFQYAMSWLVFLFIHDCTGFCFQRRYYAASYFDGSLNVHKICALFCHGHNWKITGVYRPWKAYSLFYDFSCVFFNPSFLSSQLGYCALQVCLS